MPSAPIDPAATILPIRSDGRFKLATPAEPRDAGFPVQEPTLVSELIMHISHDGPSAVVTTPIEWS